MKKCDYCGQLNSDDASSCSGCGQNEFSQDVAAQAPTRHPPFLLRSLLGVALVVACFSAGSYFNGQHQQVPAAHVSPVPTSAPAAHGVLRMPTVQVTYSGISPLWAQRMARVLAEARTHARRQFGFNMPGVITLTVTVAPNREYKLFNDMRDQVTYYLRSEADLAGFEAQHWYLLYGMSHEVAHLAMYRTFNPHAGSAWLNWDAQEAWAHYLAERLADLSYLQCVSEFWPKEGLAGKQSLAAQHQSAQDFFPLGERQLAEHWRALVDIVGDRGIEPLFETWNKATLDPQHPADAVSRTFNGHPKAEELRRWWLQAAPLMLTQPGKSPFPPASGWDPSGDQKSGVRCGEGEAQWDGLPRGMHEVLRNDIIHTGKPCACT